jgi:hypothetical protein
MNAPRDGLLGVFEDMPIAEYHASTAVSNSKLKALADCPAVYFGQYEDQRRPADKPPTPALVEGALAHCLTLEPGAADARYAIKPPDHDGRTREGKAWLASVPRATQVVTDEQWRNALEQAAAVRRVPELAEILAEGRAEVSAFWIDAATGVHCRCRPDFVHPLPDGRDILFDLKSTPDSRPEAFRRAVYEYGYHRQAAFYTRGWQAASGREVAAFVFGAVNKTWPFIAVPCLLDDPAMERGDDECTQLLQLYTRCRAAGVWPAYGDGVHVIGLPAWARPLEIANTPFPSPN